MKATINSEMCESGDFDRSWDKLRVRVRGSHEQTSSGMNLKSFTPQIERPPATRLDIPVDIFGDAFISV